MVRFEFLLVYLLGIFSGTDYFIIPAFSLDHKLYFQRDQVPKVPQQDNQLLYNGRIWRSLYYNIKGDEFLFSKDFLKGNVTINGKTFNNTDIKYDIYNDEIVLLVNSVTNVQLNKEMVAGFDIIFNNIKYQFTNITGDSLNGLTGYANILYKGNTTLYLKFKKEIIKFAVEGRYDEFYQKQQLYLLKDGMYYRISGKKDLLNLLKDKSLQIKDYIKQEKIKVRQKEPESFVLVLEYYDSLH